MSSKLSAMLFLLAALCASMARADGATDAEMAQLFDAVERDPGALNRMRPVLERLTAPQMAQAIASTGNSHFTWLYPMILRAQDYPALEGLPIAQLSVVALRGDKLVPIPFQIDEFDTRGLVFVPGVQTPGIFNPGGLIKRERETDGVAGRYDRGDELVFMYRDAGRRRATAAEFAKITGKVLATLELKREGLPVRYAYVMQNQPLRAAADYVKVNLPAGTVQTTVADIVWDPDSMALLKKIAPRVGPSSGKNIIDGVYGEVSTGLMQKNLRFSLNTTDNIRVQPIAVRDGPVRAVLLVKLRIFYAGLPVFHDYLNVAMYEQGASLLARVRLDSLDAVKYFVGLIKEPHIEATIDFANLDGAEVRWEAVHAATERAIVDGEMNGIESAMNSVRMPGDWLWMDSKRGWQFFFSNNFSVEQEGLLQAFLDGMDIHMIYEDGADRTREGEQFPGAGPRFGVTTRGMPLILVNLLTSMRGIDLGKLKSVEELIDAMIELDEQGKLDRLNQNIDLVHKRLVEEGKVSTIEDVAELLVRDIRRIGFRPAEQEQLARLARRAVLEAGNLEQYRLGQVLKAMKRIAQEEGFDFNKLQFALLDNTLWFPDNVGEAGPAAFDREVRNPPRATLLPP